ncbi:MAG: GNAT family N-acetyltransferase [Bermanella sp.]
MEVTEKPLMHLKPLDQNHISELHQLIENNRGYLREWLPWLDNIKLISDTANFIGSISHPSSAPHFGVFHQGRLCGVAGFHEIETQIKVGTIGYWLAQNHAGKGIISAAVKELLEIGFKKLKLEKIEIRCAKGNVRSRSVAQGLGFTYVKTLPDNEWLYDKYVDHVVYSKDF